MTLKTILTLIFAFHLSYSAQAKTIEKIVAIINSQILTKTDLESYRNNLKEGGLIENTLIKYTDVDKLESSDTALLDHMINERLVDSLVKKSGIAITIERVESEIRNIASRKQITRAQLKQALKQKGIKFSDYQEFVKKGLERHALISKEVSSKIKISDDDVSSYYIQQNKNSKTLVFAFKLAHILFLPKNGGEAKSQERAELVLAKLKNNGNFDDLASQYSEDPNFTHGGVLGEFKQGEMLADMEKAIVDLKAGEFSKIVKTRAGFHILKVIKKTLVPDPQLEEQKEVIRRALFSQSFDRNFVSWLKQLRKDSYIHIN